MAFTEVSWTNGDTITEVKLDNMVASDVHVRAEGEYKTLFHGTVSRLFAPVSGGGSAPSPDLGEIDIDGAAAIVSETSGSYGEDILADHDISALAEGIHYFRFLLSGAYYKFRWVKTADMDRITIWYNYNVFLSETVTTPSGQKEIGLQFFDQVTIIGHSTVETWTV